MRTRKGPTYLYVVPVLHCESVQLVDDENLDRGEEVCVSVKDKSNTVGEGIGAIAHFSFSIDILRPRGLATIRSQP